jgi:hypothetical protein
MRVRVDLSDMTGESTEIWTPILGIYEFELDWSDQEHSGEVYITVANHPALGTLHPFNRIRLVDFTKSPEFVFFVGRINQIKPVFKGALATKGSQGYAFQIYARDYMQSLADNFVQADKMHDTYAFKAASDSSYVPIYETGGCPAAPPCASGFMMADCSSYAPPCSPGFTQQEIPCLTAPPCVPGFTQEDGECVPCAERTIEFECVPCTSACVPCTSQEPATALRIITDLVTRLGIIPDVTPTVTAPLATPTINLHRNYMSTPQASVFAAVAELANEHPWTAAKPPPGVGYVFRIAPPGAIGNGAVFEFFQRGQLEWDVTQVWGFQGATIDGRIPIQTFSALQEGRSIYSRSRVMGKGVSSFTAPSVSIPSMEDTWNPEEGLYKVTRESTSNDEILTQLDELQYRARGNLVSDPATKSFRGERLGTITVVGIPTNANRIAPVAGDTIQLDPPPEGLANNDDNKYVISNWHLEWPSGFSTYTLNRRPKARAAGFNQLLMRRGLGILSSLKDIYDSGWMEFSATGVPGVLSLAVPRDNRFVHRLGTIPRQIFAYAADTTTVSVSIEAGLSNQVPSAVIMERARYDPIYSLFAGFEVTGLTKDYAQLNFYPLLAFSEAAAADPNSGSDGWLKKDLSTAVRVFILP